MQPAASAVPRARRTQQERRESTRGALLEATIASMIERGYGGTTTLEVERRAGVSRGARIHHFPTKAALLASAVDHLYDAMASHYEQAFGQAQPGASDAERLAHGVRVMWSLYRRPGHAAALELSMAARTDEELRARLHEVALRHRALAIAAGSHYFPGIDPQVIERLVLFIHSTLIGLLMECNVAEEPARDEAVLSSLEAALATYLPASDKPRQ